MPMPNFLNPMTVQPATGPYAQQAESERLMGLSQALMQQQMQAGPSGWANIAQAILTPYVSSRLAKRGERGMEESLQKQAQMAAEAKRAAREEKRQYEQWTKEQLKAEREKAADEYGLQGAARLAFTQSGTVPPELLKGKEYKMEGGFRFDPTTGEAQPIPGYAETQARIQAAGRAPQQPSALQEKIALARQFGATDEQIQQMVVGGGAGSNAPSGYRMTPDGNLAPIPGGPADPATKGSPIGQEAQNKLALIDNAIANAREYQRRVVGQGGTFNDIDSRLGDTPELLKSAIQDSLYVKSGASAPVEEVRKWEEIYGPSTVMGIPTERDSTSASKVNRLLADLERQRAGILGQNNGGQAAAAPGQPAPAAPQVQEPVAVNPQTGQKIVLRNGQWVPL